MGLDTYITDKKGNELYWRKANFLHKWFADRLYPDGEDDNLNAKSFPATWLDELEGTCNKVLENPKKAQNLLPTSEGFFWGHRSMTPGTWTNSNTPWRKSKNCGESTPRRNGSGQNSHSRAGTNPIKTKKKGTK